MSSSEEEIGDPVDVSDDEVEVDNEEEVVSELSDAEEQEDSDEVMDEEQEEASSSFIDREPHAEDDVEQPVDVDSSPQIEEVRSEVEAASSDQPEIPSEEVEIEPIETDPAEAELQPEQIEVVLEEDRGSSASTHPAVAPVEVTPVELSILEKWKEVRHELDESRPRVFGDSQRENLGKIISS